MATDRLDSRGRLRAPLVLLALVALAAVAVLGTPARAADDSAWQRQTEHWYVLEIAGAAAGSMREATFRDGERWRTETETILRIARGAVELRIVQRSAFVETDAGVPLELVYEQKLGQQELVQTWTFRGAEVDSVARQGGREVRATVPAPSGDWLTPMGVQRMMKERLAAGAERFTLRSISGETGLEPIETRHERTGTGTATIDGREIPTTIWSAESSVMPGVVSTLALSSDGVLVDMTAPVPGLGAIRTRLATEAEALATGHGVAPEVMVRSFVAPSRPIARAREQRRLAMRLRAKDGALPEIPSAGYQRAEKEADGSVRIVVDLDAPQPAGAAERDDPAYLAPSGMIDGGDEQVARLAARATRDAGPDPAAQAEACRAFVHRFVVDKALDTAFATASEVARERRGDCSEHAVLLAAMLRARDIPSRVAAGLVYADAFAGERDIFGWHMWTQALVDGRWIDLDATLPVSFDAAHILVGTSPLADAGGTAALSGILMVMGNLEIVVED